MLELPNSIRKILKNKIDASYRPAILYGAGLSYPSGLFTAKNFIRSLLKVVSTDCKTYRDLRSLCDPPRNPLRFGQFLRFEAAIEAVREVDTDLEILNYCADTDLQPCHYHHWLAIMIKQGYVAVSPNYDTLVERACTEQGYSLKSIIFDQEYHAQYESSQSCPLLFKIHGCILKSESIQATLRSLSVGGLLSLSESKKRVFRRILEERPIIIAGYSASDDFDIVPEILGTKSEQVVIAIEHHDKSDSNHIDVKVFADLEHEEIVQGRASLTPLARMMLYIGREREGEATRLPERILFLRGDTSHILKELILNIDSETENLFISFPQVRITPKLHNPRMVRGYFQQWSDAKLSKNSIDQKYSICRSLFHSAFRPDLSLAAGKRIVAKHPHLHSLRFGVAEDAKSADDDYLAATVATGLVESESCGRDLQRKAVLLLTKILHQNWLFATALRILDRYSAIFEDKGNYRAVWLDSRASILSDVIRQLCTDGSWYGSSYDQWCCELRTAITELRKITKSCKGDEGAGMDGLLYNTVIYGRRAHLDELNEDSAAILDAIFRKSLGEADPSLLAGVVRLRGVNFHNQHRATTDALSLFRLAELALTARGNVSELASVSRCLHVVYSALSCPSHGASDIFTRERHRKRMGKARRQTRAIAWETGHFYELAGSYYERGQAVNKFAYECEARGDVSTSIPLFTRAARSFRCAATYFLRCGDLLNGGINLLCEAQNIPPGPKRKALASWAIKILEGLDDELGGDKRKYMLRKGRAMLNDQGISAHSSNLGPRWDERRKVIDVFLEQAKERTRSLREVITRLETVVTDQEE